MRRLVHLIHHIASKFSVFIVLLLIFFYEWRKGYFTGLSRCLKSISFAFCLQLFGLFAALSVGLLFVDVPLLERIQHIHHPFFDAGINCGAWLGRGCNIWFLVIGCYFFFTLFRNNFGSRLAFGTLFSIMISGALTFLFKHLFLRARPYAHYGSLSFFHLKGLTENAFQSFPSGDVVVVSGAVAFLFYAARNLYLRWALLLLPFATALSRISLDHHWPSDTFFSIGIGFTAASLIWQYQNCLKETKINP